MWKFFMLICAGLACSCASTAQDYPDSLSAKAVKVTQKYIGNVKAKSAKMEVNIDHQTEKYLAKLQKIESRIAGKLSKLDKIAGKALLTASGDQYKAFAVKLTNGTGLNSINGGQYMPYTDSIKGVLSFLQSDKLSGSLFQQAGSLNLDAAANQFNQLQDKLKQAELVKQFITERKQQIKDVLNHYTNLPNSLTASLANYNKEAYYYTAQIREYKELLNDPDKLERKTLAFINQLPAFQTFMKEHSDLAGLFNVPGNYGETQSLVGLQTRDQVQQLISNQLGGGQNVGQLFGQQIQIAKKGLDGFKDKLNSLGGGSGDIEMPNFKPNQQKTRSFLRRLEYGTNLQTTRSGYWFPTTTDIALSVGYKLSNKNSIGIGMSYKIGWGKDIRHIAITSEGIGLRSYADFQVHKTLYASGGFEYNYQEPFNSLEHIRNLSDWSKSGLIGVSKIISLKTRVFKKTKLQLLWDFLSYQQRPVTQPLKFRVGYNF